MANNNSHNNTAATCGNNPLSPHRMNCVPRCRVGSIEYNSSPIVITLRAASPNYIPSLRLTFG